MTEFFSFLPEKVSFKIFSYLINADQILFIHCNHFFHQQWIRTLRSIVLHYPLSELFLIDTDFRKKVLLKINDPLTQLSILDFPFSREKGRSIGEDIKPSFHVSGLHKLEVDGKVFKYLMEKENGHGIVKIEHLSIRGSMGDGDGEGEWIKVSYFKKVMVSLRLDWVILSDSLEDHLSPTLIALELHSCKVKRMMKVKKGDVNHNGMLFLPPLPNLKKLVLESTRIKNLEEFHYLNELCLSYVRVDNNKVLVNFQHIPNLTLQGCEGIVDITCLQDNHSVTIVNCPNIIDYSRCLAKTKNINLQFPLRVLKNIRLDISNFLEVESLTVDFSNCILNNCQISSNAVSLTIKNVILKHLMFDINLGLFQNVKTIKLEKCSGLKSLQGLFHVEKVMLVSLDMLTSLEGLGRNKEVEVISCPKITDFSAIRFVPRVLIQSCDGFRNAKDVFLVYDLTIIDCSELVDISKLANVHTLTVQSCPKIVSIKALEGIRVLNISDCKNLKKYKAPHFDLTHRFLNSKNGLGMVPDSVYGVIFEFLQYKERIEFISTSSYLHGSWMRKARQITLTKHSSLQLFFRNATSLSEILQKIENPMKQLQVLKWTHCDVQSGFYCCGYQKLEAPIELFFQLCQRNIHPSSSSSTQAVVSVENDWKVYHLAISDNSSVMSSYGSKTNNFPFREIEPYLYKAIESLDIEVKDRITSLDNLSPSLKRLHIACSYQTIVTLPLLPKLKILSLASCKIKNLTDFHYLQELCLHLIPITDVTPFQTIPRITFSVCEKLEDISPLQSHQCVETLYCTRLREYRNALSRCKEIVIDRDDEIEDDLFIDLSLFHCVERFSLCLANFQATQEITLSNGLPSSLREIELTGDIHFDYNFKGFDGLQRVTMESCSLKSLTGFGLANVHEIVLSQLEHLTSLKGINHPSEGKATHRSVEINNCRKITDFSPLNDFHKVSIRNCIGFSNGFEVNHVHELFVDHCWNLRDISMLRKIPKLEITNCGKKKSKKH